MNSFLQGLITGATLTILFILSIGANQRSVDVGRYQYYVDSDNLTKEHYSRIFDTATGVVYHKSFIPGGEQVDLKWVNEERIERKHFRPDLTIWKSESWNEYKRLYEENRNFND
tara:strand:+ start:41 stop:382 length:342 start_codon:yes stop_codon:yes gene_type:complete